MEKRQLRTESDEPTTIYEIDNLTLNRINYINNLTIIYFFF